MAVHHWSKSTGYALSQTEKLFLWIEGPTKSKNSMFYPNKWLIALDLVTLDQGWMWLNCFFLAANRSMLRGGLTLDSCCWCKLWKTSTDYQCSSPNQIHTKPVSLSVSLQSDWDNHKVKFWWDSYPRPALLHFSWRSLVESSGYQGLNFPDPRTRRNTICYYTELREDDTGRPHQTEDKGDGTQSKLHSTLGRLKPFNSLHWKLHFQSWWEGLTRTLPWCSTFACVFPDVLTNY